MEQAAQQGNSTMGFFVGIAIFAAVVWMTASLCTRKGWPLWMGLALGILLQFLGRFLAVVLTLTLVYLDAWFAALSPAVCAFSGCGVSYRRCPVAATYRTG